MSFFFSRIFTHVQCRLAFLLLFAIASFAHAYDGECGSMTLLENIIKERKRLGYTYARVQITNNNAKCSAQDYYDSVYTIETSHFQVMYVLTGPHATTKAFADSTASSMEAAWNLYVNTLNMRTPQGFKTSYHYKKKVKDGLYPIEIVDIGQVDGYACNSCYGLTLPPLDNSTSSQIFMDNDFFYGASTNPKRDTIFANGDTCLYSKGYIPLQNKAHNYSYSDKWEKGIRLTSFHELYHAVQLRYLNMSASTFWFEASASGFEEITNPDVDDYFAYLPAFFNSIGEPISDNFRNYGAATLFIYLYQKVSNKIDKSIWENFSKNPQKPFEDQLETSLASLKLDADSVFHDYAVRLSFSGSQNKLINKKDLINEDQSEWPNVKVISKDTIKPDLKSLAFNYFRPRNESVEPDLTNFIGKATVIAFRDGKATIHRIQNNKTLQNLAYALSASDSTTWIFSRLGKSESIPIVNNTADPHAFPVPWRQGPLCFAPLPKDKDFIEIRNRRGDLVSQEKYAGTTYCLQEDKVKSMMAPGVYHFRVGNKGKTTKFIIVH